VEIQQNHRHQKYLRMFYSHPLRRHRQKRNSMQTLPHHLHLHQQSQDIQLHMLKV
jgi:hypothetical protein